MTRNDARNYIIERAAEYLQPDNSRKGYICPICGSGTGKNGTGITTKDGIHFTCWAGCFKSSDVIDIIGQKNGLTDYSDKLKAAASYFGITIDGSGHTLSDARADFAPRKSIPAPAEPETDYTDFFLQAHEHLPETDYRRGLSDATLSRFNVGYVAEWRHPKAPNAPSSPRLIIPTSKYSYLARDTRAELTPEQKKYSKSKVGRTRLFNADILQTAALPVFIVEGEIDAMSITEVGGEAVALGSVSNIGLLMQAIKEQQPQQPMIAACDADEKGAAANKKICDELQKLGIPCVVLKYDEYAEHVKDANELLNVGRDKLKKAVDEAGQRAAECKERAAEEDESRREEERDALRRESAMYSLQDFLSEIGEGKPPIPTGFTSFDKLLDGGLYPGLYIVGAISSLGKTTFCLQIADNIARSGHDVLIFSLEMARNELIAKSISRLSLAADTEKNGTTKNAKTTRGILDGSRYIMYSDAEQDVIRSAIETYKTEYASRIYITEGVGDLGVNEIRERVVRHIRVTGEAPIVLIDYLQILAPADVRATDKQNTDKAVMELKRISRDYGIPVIGISSFNRDSYNAPVNLSSFKESGAIEYSSDVLIGLQYDGMDDTVNTTQENSKKRDIAKIVAENNERGKNGDAQHIQVKVLKGRNAVKGDVLLDFYPRFNFFTEPKERKNVNAEKRY